MLYIAVNRHTVQVGEIRAKKHDGLEPGCVYGGGVAVCLPLMYRGFFIYIHVFARELAIVFLFTLCVWQRELAGEVRAQQIDGRWRGRAGECRSVLAFVRPAAVSKRAAVHIHTYTVYFLIPLTV